MCVEIGWDKLWGWLMKSWWHHGGHLGLSREKMGLKSENVTVMWLLYMLEKSEKNSKNSGKTAKNRIEMTKNSGKIAKNSRENRGVFP